MLPFIEFGKVRIPSYGLMACIGLLTSFLYIAYISSQDRKNEVHYYLVFITSLIGCFLGAKILSVIINPELYVEIKNVSNNVLEFMKYFFQIGYVFYGGLFGALLSVLTYFFITKADYKTICSKLIILVPWIHGLGRIGCFMAGCCYGAPNELLGIAFNHSLVAPNGIKLIPVQLYESLFEMIMVFLLLRNKHFYQQIVIYLTSYSIFRFLIEFVRYDHARGIFFGFSTSQWISILTIIIVIVFTLKRRRKINVYQNKNNSL